MTTKDEATEMRVEKVRVDGCSTIESPTFANDVENDGNRKTCFVLECSLSASPAPAPKEDFEDAHLCLQQYQETLAEIDRRRAN